MSGAGLHRKVKLDLRKCLPRLQKTPYLTVCHIMQRKYIASSLMSLLGETERAYLEEESTHVIDVNESYFSMHASFDW